MELMIVIAAAIVAWAAGSLWYMVFAGPWVRISSLQVENRGALRSGMPMPYLMSGLAMVVFVGMMRYLWLRAGIDSLGEGLVLGLMVGAFIILPWTVINHSYARRPPMQTLIAGGYVILAGGVAGAILGAI